MQKTKRVVLADGDAGWYIGSVNEAGQPEGVGLFRDEEDGRVFKGTFKGVERAWGAGAALHVRGEGVAQAESGSRVGEFPAYPLTLRASFAVHTCVYACVAGALRARARLQPGSSRARAR